MISFPDRRRKLVYLSAVFFCLTLAAIFLWHRQALEKEIEGVALLNLNDYAKHSSSEINQRLSNTLSMLDGVADLVAREEYIMDPQVMRILRRNAGRMPFDSLAVALPNGYSFASDFRAEYIQDRKYFQDALSGAPNISEVLVSRRTGRDVIVFATPIIGYEGVRGILCASFSRKNFPAIFHFPLFGGRGLSYVVDGKGNVVLAPEGRKEAVFAGAVNIFEGGGNISPRYDHLRNAMKNNMADYRSGAFKYDAGGEIRYLNYSPLGVNDWYLISVIPGHALLERFGGFVNITFLFGMMIFALFAMIGGFTYFVLRRQMQETDEARGSLETLIANIPGGVSRCLPGDDLAIADISDGYLKILDCRREDFSRRYQDSFVKTVHPEDRERVLKTISEQIFDGSVLSLEYRIITADGAVKWIFDRGRHVRERGGKYSYYHVVFDNTEAKSNADALALSEERYRIVTENSDECLFDWNLADDVVYFSTAYQKRFGDSNLRDAVNDDDRDLLDAFFESVLSSREGARQAELRLRTLSGDCIWCRIQGTPVVDINGSVARVVGTVKDVSDQVREREELMAQAQTDSLTGLCDKGTTQSLIADFLALSSSDRAHAMFICDVDNFKTVNDSFGHLYGDTVLGDLARKLRSTFRGTDVVGRIGGDEFMILMKDVPSPSLIHSKALEIRAAFRQNYEKFSSSGSIGIAMFPQDGTTFSELYQMADTALYHAKQNGKDCYVLYQEIDAPQDVLKKAEARNVKTIPDQPQGQKAYSENITEYVFKILYTTNEFEEAVNLALSVACRYLDMSRGYIFEYDAKRTRIGCTFEYCQNGVRSVIDSYPMRPLAEYPHFLKHFDESDIFFLNSPDEVDDPAYRGQLIGEGVVNMLQCAFNDKGVRRGVLGFDDCRHEGRLPTSEEIETLSLLADIIGSYILKERQQKMLAANFQIQETILNSLHQWVFVVDSNWEVAYFNDELRRCFPNIGLGKKCFRVLHETDLSCKDCPLEEMRRTGSGTYTMKSCFSKAGFSATINVTAIREGEEEIYTFCAFDVQKDSWRARRAI